MNLPALIIQLIAGALGGNAAGSMSKDVNLGPMGNSLAGAIGGGLGGQIFSAILGLGGTAAASGLDIGSVRLAVFSRGGPRRPPPPLPWVPVSPVGGGKHKGRGPPPRPRTP